MAKQVKIAPLQLIAVAFHEPDFKGQIAKELDTLRANKTLRIVDGLVVSKDNKGKITVIEGSDLTLKEAGIYGGVIGGLLGLGTGDEAVAEASAGMMAQSFEDRYQYGLDKEDVADLAAEIPKDTTTMLLLVEHLWAAPLRDAMRDAGGTLLAQDFLSPELLMGIGQKAYSAAAA
jgi:uncharacterized membrane protein